MDTNIVNRVFAEVCLDERVSDGIFKLEEEQHMNALRDYFVKKGIPKNDSIHVTNRMVEGRFPERQAYNKDGILVTFPTPKHKAAAIQKRTHFEKNPAPQNSTPKKDSAPVEEPIKRSPPIEKDIPPEDGKVESPEGNPVPQSKKSSLIDKSVDQGGQELEVEPPRGEEKPQTPAVAEKPPIPPPAPRTPERVAAEKEVVKQIINTDDNTLPVSSPVHPLIPTECQRQLNEFHKKAADMGLNEAVSFLAAFVKS